MYQQNSWLFFLKSQVASREPDEGVVEPSPCRRWNVPGRFPLLALVPRQLLQVVVVQPAAVVVQPAHELHDLRLEVKALLAKDSEDVLPVLSGHCLLSQRAYCRPRRPRQPVRLRDALRQLVHLFPTQRILRGERLPSLVGWGVR